VVPPPVANVRFVCRQCPQGGLGMFIFFCWIWLNSDLFLAIVPAGFQCPVNQNHILCQCCIQPMPDRRDEVDIHQHCE